MEVGKLIANVKFDSDELRDIATKAMHEVLIENELIAYDSLVRNTCKKRPWVNKDHLYQALQQIALKGFIDAEELTQLNNAMRGN